MGPRATRWVSRSPKSDVSVPELTRNSYAGINAEARCPSPRCRLLTTATENPVPITGQRASPLGPPVPVVPLYSRSSFVLTQEHYQFDDLTITHNSIGWLKLVLFLTHNVMDSHASGTHGRELTSSLSQHSPSIKSTIFQPALRQSIWNGRRPWLAPPAMGPPLGNSNSYNVGDTKNLTDGWVRPTSQMKIHTS